VTLPMILGCGAYVSNITDILDRSFQGCMVRRNKYDSKSS